MSNDWRQLYPFESRELPLGGQVMRYVDEGGGRPLLMSHGNPTWSFYWRNLVLAFRDRFRTVAVDHMGCGRSDKPQRYDYSLATHIDNLVELVDHLELGDITLLAHDWGGAIGLGAALRRPERFSRIVLFNTGAFPPPFIPLRIRVCRTPLLGRVALRGLNLFARAATWMAVENRGCLSPAVRAGLLAPYDNWAHRVAIWRFVRDIPMTPSHPTWRTLSEIEAGLPTLADRPIQLIWGAEDWCFDRRCFDRFRQHFPDAETHLLEGAGHYVVEEAVDRILSVLTPFLEAETSPRAGLAERDASLHREGERP